MSTDEDLPLPPDDPRVIRQVYVGSTEGQALTTDGEQQIADAIKALAQICMGHNAPVLISVCTRGLTDENGYRTMGGAWFTDIPDTKNTMACINLIDVHLKKYTLGRFRVLDLHRLAKSAEEEQSS